MSQASPAKRTEELKDEDQTPPVRSTYWYDDGNIILQAENTQLRVHRSLLSQHSNVFKDMFSLPQPSTDPDVTPEGCPVVFLSDKAADLECVMSVIYHGIRVYHIHMRKKMAIDFLGTILRMGKKYDIDHLCKEGLKRLRLEYPTTLTKWHACYGAYRFIKDESDVESTVLGLCHELSIPSCLPAAYVYFVASRTLEDILGSSVNSGGTLDHEIVMQCVRGRDKLVHACHAILRAWVDEGLFLPSQGCSSKFICAINKLRVIQNISLFQMEDDSHFFLNPWDTDDEDDLELCASCLAFIKTEYNSASEDLWSQLPSFFGLPPWGELKDFDM